MKLTLILIIGIPIAVLVYYLVGKFIKDDIKNK